MKYRTKDTHKEVEKVGGYFESTSWDIHNGSFIEIHSNEDVEEVL